MPDSSAAQAGATAETAKNARKNRIRQDGLLCLPVFFVVKRVGFLARSRTASYNQRLATTDPKQPLTVNGERGRLKHTAGELLHRLHPADFF